MLPALKPPPEKERAERRRKRVQVCTKHSRGDIDCLRLCLGRLGWVEKPKGAERADIFWFSRGLDDVRPLHARPLCRPQRDRGSQRPDSLPALPQRRDVQQRDDGARDRECEPRLLAALASLAIDQ